MKRKRFTEEQIMGILQEAEKGQKTIAEVPVGRGVGADVLRVVAALRGVVGAGGAAAAGPGEGERAA